MALAPRALPVTGAIRRRERKRHEFPVRRRIDEIALRTRSRWLEEDEQ